MATHVEGFSAKRFPTKGAWIGIGTAIVLVAAVGGGILIGRSTVEEPAPPPEPLALAPDKFVTTIDANIAALNAGDEHAYLATWGEGGEFTFDLSTWDIESFRELRSEHVPIPEPRWSLERSSEVIFVPRISNVTELRVFRNGPYAAHTFSCVNEEYPEMSYTGIAVYRFYGQARIVHQWVMAPARKWVPGCY